MSDDFGEVDWSSTSNASDNSESVGVDTNIDKELHNIPIDWTGWTKVEKVQHIVEVIQHQNQLVRTCNFDLSKKEAVAALALEGQIELADFLSEAESYARDAKNLSEYAEAEAAERLSLNSKDTDGKKLSEAALKRKSSIVPEVKESRKQLIMLEKDVKKWKYIYDTLKDAHIFFRNLGKD